MMMRYAGLVLLCLTLSFGCVKGPEERVYQLKPPGAMKEAQMVLENYAQGGPYGSEVEGFDRMIEKVNEEAPSYGAIVSDAFKKIKENPGSRQKVAKDALAKLPSNQQVEEPAK
ncbi:hypothetical protein LOC68_23830 [Blastopirellula sp. JC732]|uniref:DUF4810 domain-containing protein n=1 Tax=Blastopirellula sediminis TaxID=2894196 RepID=A0A9X1SJ25_9BACT|nr:hypothetical protein [Blastopirellula sediminis]MCC9605264.1 hypothetical protein [Blastopirellula sediminis]MCC9631436.1 hypothetical protein [Blastopirellula sediminis]